MVIRAHWATWETHEHRGRAMGVHGPLKNFRVRASFKKGMAKHDDAEGRGNLRMLTA